MFFHVSPYSFFGVIGVDFIRMAITNVIKVGFSLPVIKTIELFHDVVSPFLRFRNLAVKHGYVISGFLQLH